MNSRLTWSLLGAAFLLAHGCGEPSAGSSELATRQASGAGGGSGLACESDLDCPEGEECELEHGESFCKPHGGDHDGAGGAGVMDCESDLDCLEGEECEFEHGGSFCKPHGDDDDQNCDGSDDDGSEGDDCSDDGSDSDDDCGDDDGGDHDAGDDHGGSNSGQG